MKKLLLKKVNQLECSHGALHQWWSMSPGDGVEEHVTCCDCKKVFKNIREIPDNSGIMQEWTDTRGATEYTSGKNYKLRNRVIKYKREHCQTCTCSTIPVISF